MNKRDIEGLAPLASEVMLYGVILVAVLHLYGHMQADNLLMVTTTYMATMTIVELFLQPKNMLRMVWARALVIVIGISFTWWVFYNLVRD